MQTLHRVHGLAAAQFACALAITAAVHGDAPAAHMNWGALVAVAVGATLAEVFIAHVQFRRDSYTYSLGEVPFVIGLAFIAPAALVVTRSLAAAVAGSVRRVPRFKTVFNASVFALETAVACAVMRIVEQHTSPTLLVVWLMLAALAANIVNASMLVNVMRVVQPGTTRAVLRTTARMQVVYVTNASLGALLVLAARNGWWLVAVGALPVVGLWAAARLSETIQQRVDQLEAVARFTDALGAADDDHLLTAALVELRDLLNVETVVMVLTGDDEHPPVRIELRHGRAAMEVIEPDDPLLAPARLDAAAVVVGATDVRRQLGIRQLGAAATPVDQCVALPFRRGGERGVVLAANRLGTGAPFTRTDASLGSAVVNHLAAVMRSQALDAELDRLARLDVHTGLLNARGLEAALHGQTSEVGDAALVLELRDAAELLGVLGRDATDRVVQRVVTRLVDEFGDAVLARTGVAQFVLVFRERSGLDIGERADRAIDLLRRPVDVDGRAIVVTPVAGVAVCGAGATEMSTLTHRAAAACTQAVRSGTLRWSAAGDDLRSGRRRLELAAALRDAIERDELTVLFQPKIDVATRRPIGAEALVRWTHPDHGPVPPPEIVELAERGGLIRRLTDHVIEMALREVRLARSVVPDASIAVNLSPQDLLDESLPETVIAMVAAAGVPTSALHLEVTEGSVMTEPERAIVLLRRLADAGIDVAVDDYGTGYSSLAYLRRLPIHHVKIDRSFVIGLGEPDGQGDEVIVRSTIDLGHNLGLKVVAEGVETELALEVLHGLGCDAAQGYLIARPLPAEEFRTWLVAQQQRAAVAARR
ncbi:MAG: EAL domain-containing protein [Acidimicrobiales bacterium]|nr:EAL domain-containing protein [Acidimicrobiales bacterium]MCB9393238.1 EAL domain-containing protein [Acidimicrobiaceae bacterium]